MQFSAFHHISFESCENAFSRMEVQPSLLQSIMEICFGIVCMLTDAQHDFFYL